MSIAINHVNNLVIDSLRKAVKQCVFITIQREHSALTTIFSMVFRALWFLQARLFIIEAVILILWKSISLFLKLHLHRLQTSKLSLEFHSDSSSSNWRNHHNNQYKIWHLLHDWQLSIEATSHFCKFNATTICFIKVGCWSTWPWYRVVHKFNVELSWGSHM